MRTGIHPEHRLVVFLDQAVKTTFLTRWAIATATATAKTILWDDGRTYPVHDAEVTGASHPFFTGRMKLVDSAGRVERFEQRYGRRRPPGTEHRR